MWTCPNCQKENEEACCTECGTPFHEMQKEPVEQYVQTEPYLQDVSGAPKKKNRGLWITCCVLGVIGLLLIVALLVVLLKGDDFQVTGLHTISKKEEQVMKPQTVKPQDANGSVPAVETAVPSAPAQKQYMFETDREGFLAYVRKQLGIPENLEATATIGEVAFWEGANTVIVHVAFDCVNGAYAGASVDPYTGELARSILPYVAPENETATTYKSYHNGRYGYSIEYPSFLTNESHGQNGSGALFTTPDDSVQMYVDGDHMAEFGTTPSLQELKREYKNRAAYSVHYEPIKDNWFVLSGEADGNVFYEKHFLKSDGTHNWFVIMYPKSREKEFDSIVTYVMKSFRTGKGADSSSMT